MPRPQPRRLAAAPLHHAGAVSGPADAPAAAPPPRPRNSDRRRRRHPSPAHRQVSQARRPSATHRGHGARGHAEGLAAPADLGCRLARVWLPTRPPAPRRDSRTRPEARCPPSHVVQAAAGARFDRAGAPGAAWPHSGRAAPSRTLPDRPDEPRTGARPPRPRRPRRIRSSAAHAGAASAPADAPAAAPPRRPQNSGRRQAARAIGPPPCGPPLPGRGGPAPPPGRVWTPPPPSTESWAREGGQSRRRACRACGRPAGVPCAHAA